jgi:hypothetical protein
VFRHGQISFRVGLRLGKDNERAPGIRIGRLGGRAPKPPPLQRPRKPGAAWEYPPSGGVWPGGRGPPSSPPAPLPSCPTKSQSRAAQNLSALESL